MEAEPHLELGKVKSTHGQPAYGQNRARLLDRGRVQPDNRGCKEGRQIEVEGPLDDFSVSRAFTEAPHG
jgi:hypothetical protein